MTGKSVTQVQGIFHKFYVTIDILANGSPKPSFSPRHLHTKGTESTGKPGNWLPMHLTNTRWKAWPSLEKKLQATKMAMDSALTTARSFNTKERRQLSKGLSAAIAAEAARNKEIVEAEDNQPQRESYQYRPHPYTRSGGRGSSRRGRGRGYDTHRY